MNSTTTTSITVAVNNATADLRRFLIHDGLPVLLGLLLVGIVIGVITYRLKYGGFRVLGD